MKKIFLLAIFLLILGFGLEQQEKIKQLYETYILNVPSHIELTDKNEYYRNINYSFVQNTTNFFPKSKQDILNIYYTIINSGKQNFSFYCKKDYKNCLNDVKELANDQTKLSYLNNFVHPYNNFKNIQTEYDILGKITIKITKSYTEDQIQIINKKLNEIENNLNLKNTTTITKMKKIHDYIINNSQYDYIRSEQNITTYQSDIAYGPLIEGYGICGGYADAMALFLERLQIQNIKISSEKHVWNAVNIDKNWYHIDLTWDDPVTADHSQVLEDKFFFINTNQLLNQEPNEHNFNQTIYQELNQ